MEICREADVTFLALHGAMGENGQIQALLDCYGIPYTGTGYAGSMLAMDKEITKQLLQQNGVRTPRWISWRAGEPLPGVSLPCVAKPCACGSSVGVSIVATPEELERALQLAASYEQVVLLEEKITGREFSVGILDGAALPAIEIIPMEGFYDYRNKYQPGRTQERCPAPLPAGQAAELSRLALLALR